MENMELTPRISPSFWLDKRVFVTGHTGFKGVWLCRVLHKLGAQVHGYALEPTEDRAMFNQCCAHQALDSSTIADVCDPETLHSVIQDIQPEVVFHLAAQSLVLESYRNPTDTFNVNVMGTLHVLEAIRKCRSVTSCVVVTTDKCYRNQEWEWGYRENDPLGGTDPYSSSKACAELLVESYRASFVTAGLPAVATARAGNVIGGGDWAEHRIIPDFFRALESGDVLRIRNPSAIRPWQHVLEPLAGYLLLAEKLANDKVGYATSWNFGPDQKGNETVQNLVEVLVARNPLKIEFNEGQTVELKESSLLMLDSSRAHKFLNWAPKFTLERALEETAAWYESYLQGNDMQMETDLQIQRYFSL